MRVLSGLLLSVFAVTGPTACNDDNDPVVIASELEITPPSWILSGIKVILS